MQRFLLSVWVMLFLCKSFVGAQETNTVFPTAIRPIVLKPNPFMLPIAKSSVRGAYPIEISYIKTTHIIFPSKIIDFDAGSEVVIAAIPEKVENILRLKADEKGFFEETNITVLTQDGGLYSFLVRYNDHPDVFTINMSNNQLADTENTAKLGIGLTSNTSPNTFVLAGGNYNEDDFRRYSQEIIENTPSYLSSSHLSTRKEGLKLTLQSLFVNKQTAVMYVQLQLKNNSTLPYEIDFGKVFIRDKNVVKRMAVQEEELPVLFHYPTQMLLNDDEHFSKVFAIPTRTLSDGKIMEIEIYEKNGGRHLKFAISNATLIKAKVL